MSSDILLRIGAEGGSLELIRRTGGDEGEKFVVHICEGAYGLDELEVVDEHIGEIASLSEAFKLMDRFRWSSLIVVEVSREIEAQVLSAVAEREGREVLERWNRRIVALHQKSKT